MNFFFAQILNCVSRSGNFSHRFQTVSRSGNFAHRFQTVNCELVREFLRTDFKLLSLENFDRRRFQTADGLESRSECARPMRGRGIATVTLGGDYGSVAEACLSMWCQNEENVGSP